MEAADLLPLELWREIALKDVEVWYALIRTIRGIYYSKDRSDLKEVGLTVKRISAYGLHTVQYLLHDELHRDPGEGPAATYDKISGGPDPYHYYYYRKGLLHRDPKEGPAHYEVMSGGGEYVKYYWRGMLHRDPKEGPARIFGRQMGYYWYDRLHRDPKDGPAHINWDGTVEYWVNGHRVPTPWN